MLKSNLCLLLLVLLTVFLLLLANGQDSCNLPKCPVFGDCGCPAGYNSGLTQSASIGDSTTTTSIICLGYDPQDPSSVTIENEAPVQCALTVPYPCNPPIPLDDNSFIYYTLYVNTGSSFQCVEGIVSKGLAKAYSQIDKQVGKENKVIAKSATDSALETASPVPGKSIIVSLTSNPTNPPFCNL